MKPPPRQIPEPVFPRSVLPRVMIKKSQLDQFQPSHDLQEKFVPPKTWKRTLPSSGRWSFKLALESRRIDPSSSSSSLPNNEGENVAPLDGGNQQQQQQLGNPCSKESALGDQNRQANEGGQTQEGHTYDVAGFAAETPEAQRSLVDSSTVFSIDDAADKHPPAEPIEPSAAGATQERGIDVWPGRAVCRDVSEKFLSWELQEGDFLAPPPAGSGTEGEMADSWFGDMGQQREEQIAVRAAMLRRQAKLWAVLRGLKTNEEVGVDGT